MKKPYEITELSACYLRVADCKRALDIKESEALDRAISSAFRFSDILSFDELVEILLREVRQ